MKRLVLGTVLLVAGCAGMNDDGGMFTPKARTALVATTQTVSDLSIAMPAQIAGLLSALFGGLLIIDKAVEKRKKKTV